MTKKLEVKKNEKKITKKMCRKKMPTTAGAALGAACPKELADMLFTSQEQATQQPKTSWRKVAVIDGGPADL